MQNKETGAPRATYRHAIWDNPFMLFPIALLCALVAWLIVTMYFDTGGSRTIYDASVNFNYQSSAYTTLDLDIVDEPSINNVRVRVGGNNTIIGNMHAEDIMVYPNYAAVSGPGEITLGLEARIVNNDYMNQGIELTVESPQSVTLVFDSVTTKTLPVTVDTGGIRVADGFTLNRVTSVPSEVTLHGPASELEQVSAVVAPIQSDDSLADNVTATSVLEMHDADGNLVEPRYTTMDIETADISLQVYQVRELPLAVDFIGTPNGFDPSSLHYSLSRETLRVAGPARIVSTLTELAVTSFDLAQEFALDRDYQRQVELPAGITSQEGLSSVTLSFDTTGMDSCVFHVSNIRLVNVPSDYDVEVLTNIVRDVRLFGPAADIARLSADNVQIQIDCQSITLTAGEQEVPVSVQIPAAKRVFAVGSYTAICQVTEK